MVRVNGHPGIYRRGSRYVAVWRHRGTQHKRSFRTLDQARRFKAEQVLAPRSGGSQRFDRYATGWIANTSGRTGRGLADSTRASYKRTIENVLLPFFGALPIDQIDPPLVKELAGDLSARGCKPATVRRYMAPLRAMFGEAVEDGLLLRNPAAVRITGVQRRRAPLTIEETRRLLGEIPADFRDLVYTLVSSGLRISECLHLRWGDLDRNHQGQPILKVRQSKSRAGERNVPLTPETARTLTRRRATIEDAGDDSPIFPSATGTFINPNNFRRRIFNPARQRAGLPHATPHLLRHGIASLMAQHGYSPTDIAAMLGHADGGVVALRTYIHPGSIRAPAVIDDLLRDDRGDKAERGAM